MKNVVIDYGMGNLKSVAKAFRYIGEDVLVTDNLSDIISADRLILPGVGAFKDAITLIRKKEIDRAINKFLSTERPFLGICLGMQMLYQKSYEGGEFGGLNIIPGEIKKFEGDFKIPQMGWNQIEATNPKLIKNIPSKYVYFVHSYYAPIGSETESTCVYGNTCFSASIAKDNVMATQFHPEKSGEVGLAILKNFIEVL